MQKSIEWYTDYVIVDIETTGLTRDDLIIELAAARVQAHQIVDTYTQLIDPGMPIPSLITRLTGISDAIVAGSPSIDQTLPDFLQFCGNLPIIGHNVGFDTSMIRRACDAAGVPYTLTKGADTLHLSRRCLPSLDSYTLHDLCKSLGIVQQDVHRALADVSATAELYRKLSAMPLPDRSDRTARRKNTGVDVSKIADAAQRRGISFAGMTFVVTGTCPLMTRDDVSDLIQHLGGSVKGTVSGKTTCLIYQDGITSTKTAKAAEFRAAGAPIAIMPMADFLQLIGVHAPDDPDTE